MVNQEQHTEARERVLIVAEQLFTERGYQAVTLRDIAQKIGIRHTSLYYHFPDGKEELFIEVTTRRMVQYREGLEQAIQDAGADWHDRLRAAANWLLTQPQMYLSRMLQSDMNAIGDTAAEQLRIVILESLLVPLASVFRDALADNPTKQGHSVTLAGMFLSLIEGVDNLPSRFLVGSKQELVDVVLDLMINGLRS